MISAILSAISFIGNLFNFFTGWFHDRQVAKEAHTEDENAALTKELADVTRADQAVSAVKTDEPAILNDPENSGPSVR